jgi:hypothetical protein
MSKNLIKLGYGKSIVAQGRNQMADTLSSLGLIMLSLASILPPVSKARLGHILGLPGILLTPVMTWVRGLIHEFSLCITVVSGYE